MNRYKSLAAVSLMLLFLAACGSTGDILGGGNNNQYELRGTVDSVDLNSRSVYLTNVSGYNTMLSGGSGSNAVRVFFDEQTAVDYQGRSYRPENLDRGDQVTVRVDENNSRLYADSMTVTYNSAGNSLPGSSYPSSGSTLRGTVRSIDTSRRTIQIDRGYGSTTLVDYNTNTPVYWNGTTYAVGSLEYGDEVDVRVTDVGGGRLLAQDVTVIRNVSSGSSSSTGYSTLRGTVRYVDTARRTIELQSTSWMSGFTNGSGSGGTMIVQYDANTNVSVQGRLNPVSGLEPGDVIDVQVQSNSGSTLFARSITLVRDVNGRY